MIPAKLTIYSEGGRAGRERGSLWANRAPRFSFFFSFFSLELVNMQGHETRQATSHPAATQSSFLLAPNNACGSEQCSHYETALSQDECLAGMLL